MPTTIYLVRHGQSIGNLHRLYLGHTDLDLSELGFTQAEQTANHLSEVNFSKIYSSDLKRAYNTAIPHAKLRGLTINSSENLRELFLGEWENMPVDDLINSQKELFVDGWLENFGTFSIPGGEVVWEGGLRFAREVERIAKENEGKTVLITSHAAVIRAFWGIISCIEKENLAKEIKFPTNASYSVVEYKDGKLIPLKYSCDEHLTNITKVE